MGEAGGGARVPAQALLRHQSKVQAQPRMKIHYNCHCSSSVSECSMYNRHDEMWQVQKHACFAGDKAGEDAEAEPAAPKRERRPRVKTPYTRLVTRARTLVSRIG